MRWLCALLVLILAAACGSPPRGEVWRIPMWWACTLNVATHVANCPCAVTEDLAQLEDSPDLNKLRVYAIQPLDFGTLARLRHLDALIVETRRPTRVSGMEKLTQIHDLAIAVPEGGLAPLAQMRQLRKLTLWTPKYASREPEMDLKPLGALRELRDLNLEGVAVRDLQPLARLVKLERLALNAGEGVDLSPLEALGGLRELTLIGEPVQDLRPLSSLKKLAVLETGPSYPHVASCAHEDGDGDGDGDDGTLRPLPANPDGIERRHRHESPLSGICEIDPGSCPDACESRPRP